MLYILKNKLIILFFTPPQQISDSDTIDPSQKNLEEYAFIILSIMFLILALSNNVIVPCNIYT